MAFQLRRGLDSERINVKLAQGELVYTTDTKKLFVGDGVTLGGTEVSLDPAKVSSLEAAVAGVQLDSSQVSSLIDSALTSNNITTETIATQITNTINTTYIRDRQSNNAELFDGQPSSFYLNYNQLANQPNILDSADVLTLTEGVGHDSALVQGQIDSNLNALDTHDSAAVQGQITNTVDAAYVQARQITYDFLDSSEVINLIDSAYIQARDRYRDSGFITQIVDSAYIQLRDRFSDSAFIASVIDSDYITARDRIRDSAFVTSLVDSAYVALRDRFQDSSLVTSTVDSSYIQARQLTYDFLDSTEVISLIDSAYVQSRVTLDGVGIDSATATTIANTRITATVDSAFVQARQSSGGGGGIDSASTISLITTTVDSAYVQLRDRFQDSSLVTNIVDSAYIQARQSSVGSGGIDSATAATIADTRILTTVDSAYVQARQTLGGGGGGLDSASSITLITDTVDSAYVQARVTLDGVGIDSAAATTIADARIAATDTHDSVAIQNQITSTVDSTYIQDRQITYDFLDSTEALNLIDSSHVQGKIDQSFIDTFDTHDSAAVLGQITTTVDAAYVQARQTTYDFLDSAETLTLIDSTHVRSKIDQAFIDTFDTHDSVAIQNMINTTISATDTHDSAAVLGQITTTVDAAYVQARQLTYDFLDSTEALNLINQTYVRNQINQTFIDTFDTHDSALVLAQINARVDQSFINTFDTHDSALVVAQINATVDQTFINAFDTHDSALVRGQIDSSVTQASVRAFIDQAFIDTFDTHDSVAVQGQIDSTVTQSFVNNLGINADTLDGQEGTYYLNYNNFSNTPTILDSSSVTSIVNQTDTHDSSLIQGQIDSNINALDTHDSAAVLGQINATVDQTFINALDTHDSNLVQGQIDSSVTQASVRAFIDQSFIDTFDTHDSSAVQGQIDSNLNALDTHDSAAVLGQINAKFANDATFSKDLNVDSNLIVGGYIGGPAVFTIDPAAIGDSTGKVIILGDLQVDGTQTTINSTTVSISDKNILLADSASNSSEADGAGITINGASATLQYASTGDKWVFNKAPYYNANRILTTADDLHDSTAVQGQIDSAVTQSSVRAFIDQSFINTFDTHDSTAIQGQIDATINALDTHDSAAVSGQITSTVTQSFVNNLNIDADKLDNQQGSYYLDYNNFTNTPTIPTFGNDFVDSTAVNTLISTADTHDSAAVVGQIDSDYIELRRPAESIFAVTNNGASAYQYAGDGFPIQSGNNPDIYLTRGKTYKFAVNASGHPFWLQTSSGAYNSGNVLSDSDGVTNNGQQSGNVLYTVPMTAPTQLYYVCQYHSGMNGNIYIDKDVGTDSSVVNSLISAADTHDSAAVSGQITSTVTQSFVNNLNVDAETLGGNDSSFYRNYNNLINKPTIPTFGNDFVDSTAVNTLISAADTHDSAAVLGQINATVTQSFVNALNIDADTLDGQNGTHYLDYNNFSNKPTIPTFGNDFVDSTAVNTLISAADTHDSAAVSGQINTTVTQSFVNNLNVDADTLDNQDGTYYLNYNNFSNKPTIPTFGNDFVDSAAVNTLISAADTHDSAAVSGQITSTVTQSFVNALNIDADTLDGQNGTYYLNYNNFSNTPTVLDSANVVSITSDKATTGKAIAMAIVFGG